MIYSYLPQIKAIKRLEDSTLNSGFVEDCDGYVFASSTSHPHNSVTNNNHMDFRNELISHFGQKTFVFKDHISLQDII